MPLEGNRMSSDKSSTPARYVHPQDPAGHLKPGDSLMVDGLDWSWAFVWYKDIVGFPGYKAGSDGSIWSCLKRVFEGRGCYSILSDCWRRLTPTITKGYEIVHLCRNTKVHTRRVHILVLEAFSGFRPEGMLCLHWDDNRVNNRIENLRWGTLLDNASDSIRNGRQPRGEKSPRAKLTEDQVREIRHRASNEGISGKMLASQYGMGHSTVLGIVNGQSWGHLLGDEST
jgi:hypothetical protein